MAKKPKKAKKSTKIKKRKKKGGASTNLIGGHEDPKK